MNTIKKTVSVLLAVMMIFSMLTIVSVSAAETSKITVTSNLCDAVEYTYNENSSQVKVTYKFQSDLMILNAPGVLTYDSKVLKLADKTTANSLPVLGQGGAVANFGLENKVKFNATSLNLYDFTTEDVFFTATFDIIGSGNTTVDLNVEVITATEAKSYDDILDGASDVGLVYFGQAKSDEFSFTSAATITSKATTDVSVFGDINLPLEEADTNVYEGSIELQAGTYKFNVNNNGTTLGGNVTYTDTAVIDYSAGYKAQTTLIATGGRYTFSFNASTKKLTIKHKAFDEIVELVGDINAELVRPNKNTTVYTGTIRLEAGTYSFNVNEYGELYGIGYSFNDSIYNIAFVYKSAATFNATGGIYSVRYDVSTNVLKILQAPAGLGDVSVFGDISLPLATQGNGVYSAQTILEAGSYEFKVDAFGTFYGNGSAFTNTINVNFDSKWKAAATLNVSSKLKFTFIFDTNTSKVKVFNAPIDTTKVKVAFDDIDALVLSSTDGVTYTGKVTLAAGTYTFRMDEFGTPMGGKYEFTDSKNNMVYNASYASATTMTATGGTYTFSYNASSNTLKVTKG